MSRDGLLSAILDIKLDCPEAKTRCSDYQTSKLELGKWKQENVT